MMNRRAASQPAVIQRLETTRLPYYPLAQIALFAALFAAAFLFFSRHSHFPVYYHPDELSKGDQLISGALNYHHPLLLLDSADLLLRASGKPRTAENAVMAGRTASAIFAALSVVFLTILAWRRGGWLAALATAVLLPFLPLMYELAHYCKEDPALLMGITLTLLALDIFTSKPSAAAATFTGAACGLAVSGKYLGIVLFLLAFPWVIWRGQKWKISIAFLVAFLATVAVINLPYLLHPGALAQGLNYELNAAQVGGAKGLSRDIPHAKYVNIFLDNIGWPLMIGMAGFVTISVFRRQNRNPFDALLFLLPAGYAILLSFSAKTAGRYFLAVAPLLAVCGTIGLSWIASLLSRKKSWMGFAFFGAAAMSAVLVQTGLAKTSLDGFQQDSRQEMAAWIAQNLPAGALVLAEQRIHLSKPNTWPGDSPPQIRIWEQSFLPDAGTLDQISQAGVRYVAVIRTSFGGYLDLNRKPAPNQKDQHQYRSSCYRRLFSEGRLLQKTGGTGVGILNPEIRLYELPATSSSADRQGPPKGQ
ncbi:MAG TPA: phospholipid carrier-dependent glycosyltransferase [Chthoniobacterales bacterium]